MKKGTTWMKVSASLAGKLFRDVLHVSQLISATSVSASTYSSMTESASVEKRVATSILTKSLAPATAKKDTT